MKLKREGVVKLYMAFESTIISRVGDTILEYSHTADDIAAAVYRVAPKIYSKYYNRFDRAYEKDDFVQDSYEHIQKLFDTGYITPDRENIDGIIYAMLSSVFVLNKIAKQSKDSKRYSWDSSENPDGASGRTSFNPYSKDLYGQLEDKDVEDPSQTHNRIENEKSGKIIADTIIDNLSFQPYNSKKHAYSGIDDILGEIELSEANLAKMYFMGYTLQAVLEVFGFGESERHSQSSYVTHKYQNTRYKINDIIYSLSKEDKTSLGAYIDTIEKKNASYKEN